MSISAERLEWLERLGHPSNVTPDEIKEMARLALRHQSSEGAALTSFTDALNRVPAREEHTALTKLVEAGHELVRAMGVKR